MRILDLIVFTSSHVAGEHDTQTKGGAGEAVWCGHQGRNMSVNAWGTCARGAAMSNERVTVIQALMSNAYLTNMGDLRIPAVAFSSPDMVSQGQNTQSRSARRCVRDSRARVQRHRV